MRNSKDVANMKQNAFSARTEEHTDFRECQACFALMV